MAYTIPYSSQSADVVHILGTIYKAPAVLQQLQ